MHSEETIKQFRYWMFVAQQDCGRWSEKTFPKSTPESIASHLLEEVDEIFIAVKESDNVQTAFEIADVMLLLIHLAHKLDIDLGLAVIDKFQKNKNRQWETEPNEKGYFKHVIECENCGKGIYQNSKDKKCSSCGHCNYC